MADDEFQGLDDQLDAPIAPPVEPEPVDQTEVNPSLTDRFADFKQRLQGGQDRAKQLADRLRPSGLVGKEKETLQRAGKKIATRSMQEAGQDVAKKTAVKQTERFAAQALARQAVGSVVPVIGNIVMGALSVLQGLVPMLKKAWPKILAVVGIFLLLPAIVFALLAGKFAPQTPTEAAEKQQATLTAYLGGNFVLGGQVTQNVIEQEQARYERIQANVDRTSPERSAELKAKVHEILSLMDQSTSLSGVAKTGIVKDIIEKVAALDSTLPFGRWIADEATSQVGSQNSQFCKVTGAPTTKACASFTSSVLYEAGVPSPIKAGTDEVWNNPALRLVVNRATESAATYYDQNQSKLQLGDIIWWGDGSCNSNSPAGKLFDHVGFYVGDNQAIDTSSSKGDVEKRTAAKRDICRVFNGAKRYGADL